MLPTLKISEAYWRAMKSSSRSRPSSSKVVIIRPDDEERLPSDTHSPPSSSSSPYPLFDCIIAGGTLGIFIGAFLQSLGHRCCVIDKRRVEGRRQEWNISRGELERGLLFSPGLVLNKEELERAIVSSFNPVRVGFKGGEEDILINDCLNLGVCPFTLIEMVREKFIAAGGVVLEGCEFKSATLSSRPDRVEILAMKSDPSPHEDPGRGAALKRSPLQLQARLLVDCMGHFSPIVKEMRQGTDPDGIVMVVGTCARGFPSESNSSADLLYSLDDSSKEGIQWFWEAFPARNKFKGDKDRAVGGNDRLGQSSTARTTYMFSYIDAHPSRPSFEEVLDRYFIDLPRYQGLPSLDGIEFKRVLFGAFPCFANAPLGPRYDRIIQMGDASASQSTLSFGGFGSLMRHMSRVVSSLSQALAEDKLDRGHLSLIHPYMPSLSSAWLFQRSMSLRVGQMESAERDKIDNAAQPVVGLLPTGAGDPEAGTSSSPSPSYPPWAKIPRGHINAVLATNFIVMKFLGDSVLRPFLQDTIQFAPLCLTMSGMMLKSPRTILRVLVQLGPKILTDWIKHYLSLMAYTALTIILKPLVSISPRFIRESFGVRRLMEALEYGSGLDHV